jgi:hypothetical protein
MDTFTIGHSEDDKTFEKLMRRNNAKVLSAPNSHYFIDCYGW